MSLDYDLGRIPNWEEECFVEKEEDGETKKILHPSIEVMVWSALSIQCDFKNIDEVMYRIRMLTAIDHVLAYRNKEPWYPPREELEKFKELRTNVTPVKRAQWHRYFIRLIEQRADLIWPEPNS